MTRFSPDDQAARTEALDPHNSFIVEASAGSGKTALLIQRFLKLLAIAELPEEIVAITFTRKATNEMRNKLLQLLRESRNPSPTSWEPEDGRRELSRVHRELADAVMRRDEERGWELLKQPQRIRIATIDSFSAEIVGRVPLLARLGSSLTPTERPDALYLQAARRTLDHLPQPTSLGAAVKTLLVQYDNDLQQCLDMIARMLAGRTQWKILFACANTLDDPQAERKLREHLQAASTHVVTTCLQALRAHLNDTDAALLHGLFRFASVTRTEFAEDSQWPCTHDFSHQCAERWRRIAGMLLRANKIPNLLSTVTRVHGFPSGSPEKQQLLSFLATHRGNEQLLHCLGAVRTMPAATYSEDQWQIVKAYARVLSLAVAELKFVFAEQSVVDFSEIAISAVAALRDSAGETDIAAAFGTRIRHLLIDEMQDTSGVQYELLQALTAGWDTASQTLFVVGDPKQSIYGFRQAEVHRFRDVQLQGLGPLDLKTLTLTTNFRSQRTLIEQWNEGFKAIFTPENLENIPFTEATAFRPRIQGANMQVHPCILEDDSQQSKLRAEQDQARKICAIIRARIDTPTDKNPLKIAVLASARTHLQILLEEFRARSIPYRALDIDTLGEVQEVRDVVALTRALLHPSDRIAWLAVLRAPWCGLTLADLHALCHGDTAEAKFATATIGELLSQDLSSLTADGQARCLRVREVLFSALRVRNRAPTASVVEHTWHSLGGPACAASHQRANIERYFDFLREIERENALNDFRVLERRLEDFYALPKSFDPAETVVDVMTIHGAKGLEWDIVFLPELHRKGAADAPRLLNWLEYPQVKDGVLLSPGRHSARTDDRFYEWFCHVRQQQNEAERKRLLYVACTRAANELHVFGTLPLDKNGECSSPRSGSLLRTGWPMFKARFIEAASQKRAAEERTDANIVMFPGKPEPAPGVLPAIAATAGEPVQLNQRRLPAGWRPAVPQPPLDWSRAIGTPLPGKSEPAFARAEGSILARKTGETIHRFLEKFTRDFATGTTLSEIQARLTDANVATMVRASGVSPENQGAVTARITAVLRKTLQDPIARWLLGAHAQSVTEDMIGAISQGTFRSVRVDRAFLAGNSPEESGGDTLWLVDYKTSENGRVSIDDFLQEQQRFYTPQLATYARSLHPLFPQARRVRVGLYYPSLSRFQHWAWTAEGNDL